jgi:hypothetical protein
MKKEAFIANAVESEVHAKEGAYAVESEVHAKVGASAQHGVDGARCCTCWHLEQTPQFLNACQLKVHVQCDHGQ